MTVSIDPQALATSLRKLQDRDESALLGQSLARVVAACTDLFEIDGSGLMLADEHGMLRYVVASDDTGRFLETAQIDTGEGPCVDTYLKDDQTDTADVQHDGRWVLLGEALAGKAIGAVLGVPVRLDDLPVGSLDVYRRTDRPFDESEQQALGRYAEVVSTMLATALRADRADELAGQLSYALEYRVPIERGIGYLMARDALTAAQAFDRLRSASRQSRRKIGAVATELLSTGHLPID